MTLENYAASATITTATTNNNNNNYTINEQVRQQKMNWTTFL